MADYDKHRPQLVIGSAHKAEMSCAAKPCPALQKWSYVQCKCIPSGILDGTIPADPLPTFGLGPQDLRYGKVPIPGEMPTFEPKEIPPPCPSNKKYSNGACICKQECPNQYYNQDGNTCACSSQCNPYYVPDENGECCFNPELCTYGMYADMKSYTCRDEPDLNYSLNGKTAHQLCEYLLSLTRRLLCSPYKNTFSGKSNKITIRPEQLPASSASEAHMTLQVYEVGNKKDGVYPLGSSAQFNIDCQSVQLLQCVDLTEYAAKLHSGSNKISSMWGSQLSGNLTDWINADPVERIVYLNGIPGGMCYDL